MTVYNIPEFDALQMALIRERIGNGFDVTSFAKPDLNYSEMRKAQKEYLVEYYKDKNFNKEQLKVIMIGLEKGIDVSCYAKSEFNALQMFEIYMGIKQGVEYEVFAKPDYSAEQMHIIRLRLNIDDRVVKFIRKDVSTINILLLAEILDLEIDVEGNMNTENLLNIIMKEYIGFVNLI